jgi:hypothetical protein
MKKLHPEIPSGIKVARQGNTHLGGVTYWPILGKLAALQHPAGPLLG